LIFASTGHNGLGGFDLYSKKLSDPNSEIVTFPGPINTTYDDFGMTLPEFIECGFMTSNRPGTGSDDIYKLTFEKYFEFLLQILVLDNKTWKPVSGAEVVFCKVNTMKTGKDGMVSTVLKRNSACDVKASAFGYNDNLKLISIG